MYLKALVLLPVVVSIFVGCGFCNESIRTSRIFVVDAETNDPIVGATGWFEVEESRINFSEVNHRDGYYDASTTSYTPERGQFTVHIMAEGYQPLEHLVDEDEVEQSTTCNRWGFDIALSLQPL